MAPVADPLALYLHVPFCASKCGYCDFNTYAGIGDLMEPYVAAAGREIRFWGRILGAPTVSTVFIGGGTPSHLRPGQLARLIETAGEHFDLAGDAEITSEANPDDLTLPKLKELRGVGVNRLSIGVQSLDDGLLASLDRRHSAAEAEAAVRRAIGAGFGNLSVDLMYGLPRQSLGQWEETLSRTLSLDTAHVSMYALTLEEGTPLAAGVAQGRMPEPDPDLAADMYHLAEEMMDAGGYRHYEISNWSRAGMESRHNLAYWRNQPYLGVGPGAHSYIGGVRFSVQRSPRAYSASPWTIREDAGEVPWPDVLRSLPGIEGVEEIGASDEMAETMMMGMRLDAGVSEHSFRARFGRELTDVFGPAIDSAIGNGLAEWRSAPALDDEGRSVRLTRRGRILASEVLSSFF